MNAIRNRKGTHSMLGQLNWGAREKLRTHRPCLLLYLKDAASNLSLPVIPVRHQILLERGSKPQRMKCRLPSAAVEQQRKPGGSPPKPNNRNRKEDYMKNIKTAIQLIAVHLGLSTSVA